MTPYSDVYEESFKCNFLGLSPDVGLPDHVTSSEIYILVTIVKRGPNIPYSSGQPHDILFKFLLSALNLL